MFKLALYGLVFLLSLIVTAKVRSTRLRNLVLLVGSYALYLSWSHWFFVVILVSTVANYLFGKWLRKEQSRMALLVSIIFNLALLGAFKYLPPIALAMPFASLQKFSHLALPLGVSFWTFQAMSYLFDLYRGEELDPSLVEFALYMAFFPIVISGPICRMTEMLPQFRATSRARWEDVSAGVQRIATGALMMLLARLLGQGIRAGEGVTAGFDRVQQWGGSDVWFLALGFGLQLFFDFAGYSHLAIGAAKALGFTLPENFTRPFTSTTPSIFWTRWHMSLSFWIRDYVFIPLAVMRREIWWRNAMLVVAMVAFGVWHKASLLFVIWGCYHGVLLLSHRLIQRLRDRFDWDLSAPIWTPLSWAATISLVSLGWIFFRANSLAQARGMLTAVFSPGSYTSTNLGSSFYVLVPLLAVGYALVLLTADALERCASEGASAGARIARNRWYWLPAAYMTLILVALFVTLSQNGEAAQLMYSGF